MQVSWVRATGGAVGTRPAAAAQHGRSTLGDTGTVHISEASAPVAPFRPRDHKTRLPHGRLASEAERLERRF